jgi:hypothetical protein
MISTVGIVSYSTIICGGIGLFKHIPDHVKPPPPIQFKIGDMVYIDGLNVTGRINKTYRIEFERTRKVDIITDARGGHKLKGVNVILIKPIHKVEN